MPDSKSPKAPNICNLDLVQLFEVKSDASRHIQSKLLEMLENVTDAYIAEHGEIEGLQRLGEDLCTRIANRNRLDGWSSLVSHLIKISG